MLFGFFVSRGLGRWRGRRIRSLFGGRLVARYEMAKVLEQMERTQEAKREYEAFLQSWPDADPDRPRFLDARARLTALQ